MKKNLKNLKKNQSLKASFGKNLKKKKDSYQETKPIKEDLSKEEQIKQQLKQAQDNYLYLKAEFENFKKQSFKEKQDIVRYASESFITSFVEDVLDDLERALSSSSNNETLEEFQKGIELILKKLHKTFKNFGIEVIDPVGKPFDPSYQEALSREKTSKVDEGHVSITFKKAYKLHDKIIRPAQVVVAEKATEDT